jgi:hypothetical protein
MHMYIFGLSYFDLLSRSFSFSVGTNLSYKSTYCTFSAAEEDLPKRDVIMCDQRRFRWWYCSTVEMIEYLHTRSSDQYDVRTVPIIKEPGKEGSRSTYTIVYVRYLKDLHAGPCWDPRTTCCIRTILIDECDAPMKKHCTGLIYTTRHYSSLIN